MKLGVYLASHNNPLFLRLALLQLEAQTHRPDILAIHTNGTPESGLSINTDVLRRLAKAGTQTIFDHTDAGLSHPFFHYIPLKRLVDSGRCNLYTKWDHDDLFYEHHLETLVEVMTSNWHLPWVGQSKADVLVLDPKQYLFKSNRDFVWNPLGGMSDTFMFNDEVAKAYLNHMVSRSGEADDHILNTYTLPLFPNGCMLSGRATTCYVSHGNNDSTANWIIKPPDDLVRG